jgi:hypothetical protein
MVLSPFSKKFWTEFYGDVFGSRAKQTWKRAGAEIMKTATFDFDHWGHEFNGDLDAALNDLDNYSADEFGLDLALLALTFAVPYAGAAVAETAVAKSAAKKVSESAVSRIMGKAATQAGKTAAQAGEVLAKRVNNAKTILEMFSKGKLTGAAARPYTRVALDVFEEVGEKGSIMIADEEVPIASREYIDGVLETYRSGLAAGTEDEALDLATNAFGRMQDNLIADAAAAEERIIATEGAASRAARDAERIAAGQARRAEAEALGLAVDEVTGGTPELRQLADEVLALLEVEESKVAEQAAEKGTFEMLTDYYAQGVDVFDEIIQNLEKRGAITQEQIATREAQAATEWERISTGDYLKLFDEAYGTNVAAREAEKAALKAMLKNLAVVGIPATAVGRGTFAFKPLIMRDLGIGDDDGMDLEENIEIGADGSQTSSAQRLFDEVVQAIIDGKPLPKVLDDASMASIGQILAMRPGESVDDYKARMADYRDASVNSGGFIGDVLQGQADEYYRIQDAAAVAGENEGIGEKEGETSALVDQAVVDEVAAADVAAAAIVKAEAKAEAKEESTDEQGGSFTGTGKMAVRQILDRVNLDELLQKCLNLSLDTYNPDVQSSPEAFPNVNMYTNNRVDGNEFDVPFLIYTEGSEMFVAFRGTSTLANVVTDISTSALGKNLPNRIADYEFPVEQHAGRLEVHAGFLKAVHEIYSFLISRIKKVSVISDIHFTGHSLGGACANLCAYIYANDTDMSLPNLGYAVSFGAPRMLFDKEDYKDDYMKSVPKCIRVWNTRDPVPYLPFKKPVLIDFFGTRMASGFTHVGKSFDLTSNQVNNNINVLLYLILMGNKSKIKSLVERMPTVQANRMLDFMLSKDFQTLILQGFFTCADRVSVNKGYTQEDIDFVMEQLQGNTEKLGSYADKCNLLRPYGLTDMMLANNLTDDVQEENFCIPGMMGLCVGANKTMTDAHKTSYYKDKLNELIDRQAAEQKFIYEVEDKDHEIFIPTNDESVKELAETTQTKFERKLSMVRGLVYVDQKEMQMLNGQVIVY